MKFPYASSEITAVIEGGFLLVSLPESGLYSVWLGEGLDVTEIASVNLRRIARENGIDISA